MSLLELAMRNTDTHRKIPCLRLKADDMPWLVVEDTPAGREEGMMLIFGEDNDTFSPEFLPPDRVSRLLVERVEFTRDYLDALPEWEP